MLSFICIVFIVLIHRCVYFFIGYNVKGIADYLHNKVTYCKEARVFKKKTNMN